jgi:signal transduction histidine kinase
METLAATHNHEETVGELAHDARNMVTALSLYCDLLEEPGVLSASHQHYGRELRLVAEASRRLVEKLALLDVRKELRGPWSFSLPRNRSFLGGTGTGTPPEERFVDGDPARAINDLCAEIEENRNLLAAMAGPFIGLTIHARGGGLPVNMTGEDLTRVLVNLVKNAAESIHGSGSIRIELAECLDFPGMSPCLIVVIEDSGHGIPETHLEKIFESGFTTRPDAASGSGWSARHQGLGLSITRSIVEAAGGRIHAENCEHGGARFVIEIPVQKP